MNSVNLTGRLASEPRPRGQGSTEICDLRLAVPRRRGNGGEDRGAVFIDVTTFGRLAANCAEHLAKGRRVGIRGRLELDEWQAKDGSPRRRHKVIAEQVEFLDPARVQDAETAPEPEPEPEPEEKPKRARRARKAA